MEDALNPESYILDQLVGLDDSNVPVAVAATEKPKKTPVKRQKEGLLCKGQRIRIYPRQEQEILLAKWVGSGRYLWNWALGKQTEYYEQHNKQLGTAKLSKELTLLRKSPDMVWLKAVPRTTLTNSFLRLDTAWTGFFDGVSGKRLDKPGKPKFRARGGSRESATFQIDHRHAAPFRILEPDGKRGDLLSIGMGEIRIPGLGWVQAMFSEPVRGEVASITIKQEGLAWYASFSLINVQPASVHRNSSKTKKVEFNFPNNDPTCLVANPARLGICAIDGSVPKGAVATSDDQSTFSLFSEKLKARASEEQERLAKYQKRIAFKHDCAMTKAGYKRNPDGTWPKRDYKIAPKSHREEYLRKYSAGISLHQLFRRHDAIHKFTTDLVMRHHTIVVETLVLTAMAQSLSRGFRRSMHEACMGEIIRQLKYKCEWHNRTLIFADQWFPSSKRCSNTACHQKNTELKLKDREWTCIHCGTYHERDDNAAFNLWQEGWRLLELYFQKNDTTCFAAGSAVRGPQGVIFEAGKKSRKARSSKPKSLLLNG
jgi:putative transposase